MHGYMNSEALIKSIESKEAHYWSRSRQKLWKKGEISGLKQAIVKILVDDDQDCMIFRVNELVQEQVAMLVINLAFTEFLKTKKILNS